MNRTMRTVVNAIAQALSVLIQSVFALVVTREIIANIGSDTNGINSTATQILTVLSLIEGGFTLATLVKLYKPFSDRDYKLLNQYISLSKKKYEKIGIAYLVVGSGIALLYTPFVKTGVDTAVTCSIMVLTVFSSAFSIFYVSKYRLLFQVSQTEYKVYFIQFGTNILMYIAEIAVIRLTKNILYVRICIVVFQVAAGFIIGFVARKRFKFLSFREEYSQVCIEGTKDVFISKFSGMIYSSASVFFISTFVGTGYTSIFAVYSSIINIISNYVNVILASPRNALGQIFHAEQHDHDRISQTFEEYEYISVLAVTYLASIAFALMIPFVRMYTSGIADLNYIDGKLALLLILIYVFQMIHIPSGTCIEVAGRFKAVKYIQMSSTVLMIILTVTLAFVYGLYGILFAKLITSIALAIVEILYVRSSILQSEMKSFLRYTCTNIGFSALIAVGEYAMLYSINCSILMFIGLGCALALINGALLITVNIAFNKSIFSKSFARFKNLVR